MDDIFTKDDLLNLDFLTIFLADVLTLDVWLQDELEIQPEEIREKIKDNFDHLSDILTI